MATDWVKARFPKAFQQKSQQKETTNKSEDTAIESKVKAAGWNYEPDKWNYGMINGRFAKWPK